MLGRIVPGRLPSTVADIKLIDQRIAFNRQQLALLPQRVAQGLLSQHDAAYRRLYLEGEIEQLTQAKRNRRYATPSYRTPLDVFESTRRGGAAKKYTPDSNRDSLPEGYFGDDNGKTGGSIPSDWNATDVTDFDVPEVPSQPGFNVSSWPAHWPGNHSALITRAVMEAGEVGMKQIVDPRQDDTMKLKGLNLVNFPPHMATAKQVKARYDYLLEIVSANPGFTVTDRTLVNRIVGKINRQISDAEAAIEQAKAQGNYREFSNAQYREEKFQDHKTGAIMKQTIFWIDGSQEDLVRYWAGDPNLGRVPDPFPIKIEDIASQMYKTPGEARLALDNLYAAAEAKAAANTAGGGKFVRYADIDQRYKLVHTHNPPSPYKKLQIYEQLRNDGKYNYLYFYDGKATYGSNNQQKWNYGEKVQGLYQFLFNGQNSDYATNGHPKVSVTYSDGTGGMEPYDASGFSGGPSFSLFGMFKRNSRNARRTGRLMGLGAMQAHDRNSHLANDGGMTPYERKSYLQAEREMALAKKRAGSKVDLTKQLREEPITRPWQMQVSLSTTALNAVSTRLNQQLASINLSQEMFTQQMHTHVAAVINSMPSGMAPSEQAEMIIEQVMAKVTNSSGLLKKDVKVDINRGSTSPLTFSSAESLSGVVGSLSGTRAALGRLLR